MSDYVTINNFLGRSYSVPTNFSDTMTLDHILIKPGKNMLSRKVWEQIKQHPCIKKLLETKSVSCVAYKKVNQIDEKNAEYVAMRQEFKNENGDEHKKLEVKDIAKNVSK